MASRLLPRLSLASARLLYNEVAGLGVEEAEAAATENDLHFDLASYSAVGGERSGSDQFVRDLAAEIRSVAKQAGYPEQRDQSGQRFFDYETARLLHRTLQEAVPAECYREEFWQFITCGALPDVVIWRFGPAKQGGRVTESRFIGFTRNTLARLWLRAEVLQDPSEPDNSYHLIHTDEGGLSEDNCVAIIERPWSASQPRLAHSIAKAFLRHRETVLGLDIESPQQHLLREAMKRVIRISAHTSWCALDESELGKVLDNLFEATVQGLPALGQDDE